MCVHIQAHANLQINSGQRGCVPEWGGGGVGSVEARSCLSSVRGRESEKEGERVRGCSVCYRLAFSTAVHIAKRKSTGGAAGLDLPVNGSDSDASVRPLVTQSGPDPSDLGVGLLVHGISAHFLH